MVPLPSLPAATKNIILNPDPGSHEAIALMPALNSSKLEVRGVTVVPGNVTAAQSLDNVLRLAWLPFHGEIPVACRQHPPFHWLLTTEFWHGKKELATRTPRRCDASSIRALLRILSLRWPVVRPDEIALVRVEPLLARCSTKWTPGDFFCELSSPEFKGGKCPQSIVHRLPGAGFWPGLLLGQVVSAGKFEEKLCSHPRVWVLR